jgi:hypothetical protein
MYNSVFQSAMQWQAAAMSTMKMSMSAAAVIQVRTMQMSLGTMKPAEAIRMVLEKPSVLMRAVELSARALGENKGLAAATIAGIAPIQQATQANAKRLSAKGTSTSKRKG